MLGWLDWAGLGWAGWALAVGGGAGWGGWAGRAWRLGAFGGGGRVGLWAVVGLAAGGRLVWAGLGGLGWGSPETENWFIRKWQSCVSTENMSFRMANSNKQFLFISFLRV